ncbi:MAG: ABC-type antimicrobial peptide transport system, permease component [Parcubacteria group bacterium Gr01-1014_3]|nr:MAG: ABC-type antimicrobial peptide transport system, permease component [Parcubacteria group bacterium Gr01-1014_3]
MPISDILHETYRALTSNKVRSSLTTLGIVIGIASVISMVSIGQGAQGVIQSSIEGLGSNLLTIFPGVVQPGRGIVSSGRGSAQSLKNEDVNILRAVEGVASVAPELSRRFQIVSQVGNNTNSTVFGVGPEYTIVKNLKLSSGVFINENQSRSLARVAVLGATAAADLFGEVDPVGKTVRIGGINFKVIGLLEAKGGAGFGGQDDAVFVPLSTMQKILVGDNYLSTVSVSVADKDLMAQVKDEVTFVLAMKHRVDPAEPDFSIISQADILGTLNQVTTTFTMFLAFVAGISLLVGGIGIMNMMLTTVTERTREIGLRKAIGAKKLDISRQFLAEALMLTFMGGLIGIILGWLISVAVSTFAGIATSVSLMAIIIAFGVCAAIGIIFGYYPARRAANLNPIEALRYE